jgi:hypothetical protein
VNLSGKFRTRAIAVTSHGLGPAPDLAASLAEVSVLSDSVRLPGRAGHRECDGYVTRRFQDVGVL